MAIKGKQLKKLTEAYLDGLRTGSSEWIPFLLAETRSNCGNHYVSVESNGQKY